MKGTIIVTQENLDDCPGMEHTLLQFSESVEREGGNTLFLSREGELMTMICELLDKDVKYTLKFDDGSHPVKVPVKVRATNN